MPNFRSSGPDPRRAHFVALSGVHGRRGSGRLAGSYGGTIHQGVYRRDMVMHMCICLLLLLLAPASAFSDEIVVSYVEWLRPSLICELSTGPYRTMEGNLRCFENLSNTGELKKGKQVFAYRDDARGPVAVFPAMSTGSDALLTMWESGAYACYMAFGYDGTTISKLFEKCTKGGIETIDDGNEGMIFLVTAYVSSPGGFIPTDCFVYHWREGRLESKVVPWKERLSEVAKISEKP